MTIRIFQNQNFNNILQLFFHHLWKNGRKNIDEQFSKKVISLNSLLISVISQLISLNAFIACNLACNSIRGEY
jgi:hypothetical protein